MNMALLAAAGRGGALLALAWALLKAFRLRDPAAEKSTWTLVLAAALVMPLLAWAAGAVTAPLRMIPLRLVASGPDSSASLLSGMASGASVSRTALLCTLVYAAGTAALLARFVIGLWLGSRLRRSAAKVPELSLGTMDVRVSALIRSPASFASTILLPTTYDTWDSATLKTVLIHEQTHVRNRDCYRLWLAAIYRVVFWFDPLAHWLHWRLHALSELTSDEAACAALGDRAAYAGILKSMASPPEWTQSMVAMSAASSLDRRLRRLANEERAHLPLARHWKMLLTSAVLLMVGLAAVPWATATVPRAAHRPAALEFYLVDELNDPVVAQQSGTLPGGDRLYAARDGRPVLVKRDVVATGDEITQVTVTDTTRIGPTVNVRLDARGAASMLSVTHQNVGHRLAAIYNGRVINDAVIRGTFGASFQVSGLTTAEAHALAVKFDGATR